MSVVTTWEAVPNRIEAVARYVRTHRGISTDELYELLSPSTLASSSNVVSRVVQESRRLGLIEADDENRWTITAAATGAAELQTLVANTILNPEAAIKADQQWVGPAVAWFLTQDTNEPLPIGENWRTRVESDCPAATNAFDLANADSCRQFAFWAIYLGFGWRLAVGNGESLVPDPTVALEVALRATIQPGEELPTPDAVERLSKVCPVLEGGIVRQAVERQLIAARQRPDGQLSRSTSFALSRLEDRGVISMPSPPADALVWTLDLWPERRRISHIRLNEGTV